MSWGFFFFFFFEPYNNMKGQNKGYEKPFFFFQKHNSIWNWGRSHDEQQKALKMAKKKKTK